MDTINPENLLLKVAFILDELGLDYYVTGGFAVSVWGRPRATFDVDIVINLIEPKVGPLARALRKVSKFGYIDEETVREAINTRNEFNFFDPETGVKIDFWVVKNDERTRIQFKRRIAKKIDKQKIYFISPEDLILNKLLWHKESRSTRHLEDIESVFRISGKKLDTKYIKQWAAKLDILDTLETLLKDKKGYRP